MGTSKKLVLASLISVMMVLAFVIGLVPSHDTRGTGAAVSSDGRVDMADLLEMILGLKQVEEITLTPVADVQGIEILTPVDNASPEDLSIPITVQVELPEDTIGNVTLVGNEMTDGLLPPGAQAGQWDAGVSAPAGPLSATLWTGVIDVADLLYQMDPGLDADIAINALLVNAKDNAKRATLEYLETNTASQTVMVHVSEQPSTIDGDDDGFPDFQPWFLVTPGRIWVANADLDADNVVRTVFLANLDDGTKAGPGTVVYEPAPGISVEMPNQQALSEAGVDLIDPAESAFALIEVAAEIDELLDDVTGPDFNTVAEWAADAMANAPGALASMASFVEVSILYSDGGEIRELKSLSGTDLQVAVAMTGLDLAAGTTTLLYTQPTIVTQEGTSPSVTNDPTADGVWTPLTNTVMSIPDGSVQASVQTLSIFAPFSATDIVIDSVEPPVLFINEAEDLAVTGIFGTATALNAAEAAAAYRVYLDGAEIPFREEAGAAITAYAVGASNGLYVSAPAFATPGTIDLTVVDLGLPGNEDTLPIEVISGTATVTTEVTGDATGVAVVLTPPNSFGFPAGTFYLDALVSAGATYQGVSLDTLAAQGWTWSWILTDVASGTDTTSGPNEMPLDFVVDGDKHLVLDVTAPSPPGTATVTTAVEGDNVGVEVVLDPPNSDGLPAGTYDLGAMVSADALYQGFSLYDLTGWTWQWTLIHVADQQYNIQSDDMPFEFTVDGTKILKLEVTAPAAGTASVSTKVTGDPTGVEVALTPPNSDTLDPGVYYLGTSVSADALYQSVSLMGLSGWTWQWKLINLADGQYVQSAVDELPFDFTVDANKLLELNVTAPKAPIAVCQDITVELDVNGEASITVADINNGSSDPDGSIVDIQVSPSSFTCDDAGDNIVILTVTDNDGLTGICAATVTVEDNLSPTGTCQDITVALDATGTALIAAADLYANASDNCGVTDVLLSKDTFTCADLGLNDVTVNLLDAAGNLYSCTAQVTVNDDIAPTIDFCPAAQTIAANANCQVAIPDLTAATTASDNCAVASITQTPALGTVVGLGDTMVTITATDPSGNTDECTTIVTVEDLDAPIITGCPAADTVTVDENCEGILPDYVAGITADDNCTAVPVVTQNPPAGTVIDVDTLVTIIAEDEAGNVSTCEIAVSIIETIPPTVTCKTDVLVPLDATGTAIITAAQVYESIDDNCAIASVLLSKDTFTCIDLGENTVTVTVTDTSGNVAECTSTITVTDPGVVCDETQPDFDFELVGGQAVPPSDSTATGTAKIYATRVGPDAYSFTFAIEHTMGALASAAGVYRGDRGFAGTLLKDLGDPASPIDFTWDSDPVPDQSVYDDLLQGRIYIQIAGAGKATDQEVIRGQADELGNEFDFQFAATTGGSVKASQVAGPYAVGTAITLEAEPAEKYAFDGWSVPTQTQLDVLGEMNLDTGKAAATIYMHLDKDVTANFKAITYTLTATADPAAGGTVTASPLPGPQGYTVDTEVTLTAQAAAGYVFDSWSGPDAGDLSSTTDPTAKIVMNEDKTVVANFAAMYSLTITEGTGGIVDVAPASANGLYGEGTVVTLTPKPLTGYVFDSWAGRDAQLVVPDAASPGQYTVTMSQNIQIAANFSMLPRYLLTVTPTTGGTVTQDPLPGNDGLYATGTEVALTAVPEAGYAFDGWSGPDAGVLSSTTLPGVTLTIGSSNLSVTANFKPSLTATAVTPNEAWIFGGLVVQITGTGLTDSTPIAVAGQAVQGFRATADGTSVEFAVPPIPEAADTGGATMVVNVTVGDGTGARTVPFTYKRYESGLEVNTTAFILETPDEPTEVLVTMNGADTSDGAKVELPALNPPAEVTMVYGIVRNALQPEVKQNTPTGTAALGTSNIAAGAGIPGSLDFSLYLYAEADVLKNTPSAGVGEALLGSASGLVDFDRTDAEGNPLDAAVRLTFPADTAVITAADVREGLTMWGNASEFDYAANVVTVTTPEVVQYQSMLYNAEVSPELTDAVADETAIETVVGARVYSLNGFTLRQNAMLSDEVKQSIFLAGPNNGDVKGGVSVTIRSPLGGLAWVKKVELSNETTKFTVEADPQEFSEPGSDEFAFTFVTPRSPAAGIADVTLYLKSAPEDPITLANTFEYTKQPVTGWWLVLLGLLVALLGLAAGGSSGGGGGGPCFIATAAYGTPLAGEIDTLRALRDTYLLDSALGTAFVDTYYRVSPAIADTVADSPVLAALVRVLLVPVIFLGKVALAMPVLTALVGMSLGAAFMLRRRARRQS